MLGGSAHGVGLRGKAELASWTPVGDAGSRFEVTAISSAKSVPFAGEGSALGLMINERDLQEIQPSKLG